MVLTALVTAAVIAQAPHSWWLAATLEPARESLRYRFDNPSSFNTEQLVPHFFEQTYDTDNLWFEAAVGYTIGGRAAQTRLAMTPQLSGRADDFDTFFQPDGNVVVAGTTGNASIRSWRVSQRLTADHWRGVDVGVTFGYRRDTARYHEGIGIVTTTIPRTEERRTVATREFVTSQMFEAGISGMRTQSRFGARLDVVAVGVARLAVQLPDKYPDRTLVFSGRYSGAAAEGSCRFRAGRLALQAGAAGGASLPWRESSAMRLRRFSLFLAIGTSH
jgi:hypothetical protein